MALDPVTNFAEVTVSQGYDASATAIALASNEGAKLPTTSSTSNYNLVWYNATDYPGVIGDPNIEIVRVTSRSGDNLTVVRGQETTAGGLLASTKNTSNKTYKMILGITAKTITDIDAAKQNYHGVASAGTLSYASSTLTIGATTNTYWYKGSKYTTSNAITCLLTDYVTPVTKTIYYFYFEDATGTLKASASVWDLKEKVPVATLYYISSSVGAIQKETHNHTRDIDWHIWAHETIGIRYESGFALTTPTQQTPNALSIGGGTLHDEDLEISTSSATSMRCWYKTSASVFTFADYSLPYPGSGSQPQYLDTDTYTLENIASNNYGCMWVYATADVSKPIYVVPTHATTAYTTLASAKAETPPVLSALGLNPEMKLIYRFVYKGDGALQETLDYRTATVLPSGGTSSVTASAVSFSPSGNIAATTVQTAIEELESDISTAYVAKSTYDAYSILYADTDNTPAALTVSASTIVGRKSSGGIVALSKSEAQTVLNVADGANNYTHPTTNGNVHIPSDGASAQLLQYSAAGTAKWITLSSGATIADGGALTLATVGVAKGGTGLTTIAAYALPYASATDTYSTLSPNTSTTQKFLAMTGTGSAGAAPTWVANPTKTIRIGHTWTIAGEIKTWSSGATDYIIPFPVKVPSGQTVSLIRARTRIQEGTSATITVRKNAENLTDFTSLSVTTTTADLPTNAPSAVTLADNDLLDIVVTAVSGAPKNLFFTLFLDYAV